MATAKRQELIGRLRELRGAARSASARVLHGQELVEMDRHELVWLIGLVLEEFESDGPQRFVTQEELDAKLARLTERKG